MLNGLCSTLRNRHGYLVYCSLGRITLLMGDTAIISGVSVSSHTFGMDRNYPTFLQHSSITHAGPHVAALCRPLYAERLGLQESCLIRFGAMPWLDNAP